MDGFINARDCRGVCLAEQDPNTKTFTKKTSHEG